MINESETLLRYYKIWSYMTQTKGVWYCLGHGDDIVFDALSILEADFDADDKTKEFPNWIEDEEVKSNLTPLSVVIKYQSDFVRIVKYLIGQSPVKTIMFMARYQSYDEEIVCGVLTFNQFWSLHNQGKILFNVCYIIRN